MYLVTCLGLDSAMEAIENILQSLLSDIRTIDEGAVTLVRVDSHIALTERLLRGVTVLLSCDHVAPGFMEAALRSTQQVMSTLVSIADQLNGARSGNGSFGCYPDVATISFEGQRGRPRVDITEDVLIYFFDHGFSATTIAMLLHVSLSTIRRRMTEFGLAVRNNYSSILDDELDRLVTTIHYHHPNCGYRLMQGHLTSLGHRVQQTRIREAMLRTDPEGVLSRWGCTVYRRQYSVPTPNALWHIDGNHRLIRYK